MGTRDANGGWSTQYVYDPMSRLVSSQSAGHTEAYTYDAFGNMTSDIRDAGTDRKSVV